MCRMVIGWCRGYVSCIDGCIIARDVGIGMLSTIREKGGGVGACN
jgi:hypothetical protein